MNTVAINTEKLNPREIALRRRTHEKVSHSPFEKSGLDSLMMHQTTCRLSLPRIRPPYQCPPAFQRMDRGCSPGCLNLPLTKSVSRSEPI